MQPEVTLKSQKKCPYCGDESLEENEQSHVYCSSCGKVVDTMSFSSNVQFANLRMQGQVIDTNEKGNANSSQKRIKKARAKIEELRNMLKIEYDADTALQAAMRVINYANGLNFFDKGKNIQIYAAAAFYMTLRFIKQPYLLIDFSEKMNVNLFKLARCFLKLLRFLGFQNQLPLIDPSIYIHRYCKMLELGDKTKGVSMTAIKLVQRMKRDWMCQGRRPSSLCGAAILIATKIHDVPCTTSDICKTVFVCDETIRRRLEQFKQTSVAKLTKQQFQKMEDGLDEVGDQMDPPAFKKARQKSAQQSLTKRIMEQLQAVPCKDKMQKIPWEQYKDNLNIPEDLLAKQVRGVEKQLEQARERYEEDSNQASQNISNYTEDIFEQQESEQQEMSQKRQNSLQEFDEDEIHRFILDEDERKMKKNLWMKHNSVWLQKQKAKKVNTEKTQKKRQKRKPIEKGKDIIESIQNTKLGNKIDHEQLKRLIGSDPQQKKSEVNLEKMFNPFSFSWNS